ncbi:MAG TPA: hypothetical protein VGC80_17285 [Acetobacteraceae bacterium]
MLAQTLRAAHPDWEIHALLVDRPPEDVTEAFAPFDSVTEARALGIPRFDAWLFRHELVEACTAVKASMFRRLLEGGCEAVVYLDPDIAVFQGLHPILHALEAASIVVTPHQTSPNADPGEITDNELAALRYGIYNLGCLGVRADATGRAFAAWWEERLLAACFDDPASGLFTDQKYCDLVPALFDGVHVERDPGCNVASWNLSRRMLRFTPQGALLANGSPLGFYHFTKIGGAGDVMSDRHGGMIAAMELIAWYRRALARNEVEGFSARPWHYGMFSNGTPVPREARMLVRDRPALLDGIADPLATGPGSFHEMLRCNHPALPGIEPSGDPG